MIVYRIRRALGRLALRWFYRDIEVVGMERIPEHGPALLASNHPNALVDALVIGCTLQRPVTLTAKATLLENPVTRALLHAAGVVPLRRASDATRADGKRVLDPSRNSEAFQAVLDVLEDGGIVLLFPEGKSHSDPTLAPLKTGLARIATMARSERQLSGLPIIPIGLTFERKWEPRSRVLMRVGTPIPSDALLPNGSEAVTELTQRVDAGLREVTLNFVSTEEERRVLSISTLLAEVLDEFRPLGTPDPPLADSVRVAQRIATIVPRLAGETAVELRVEAFLERAASFDALRKQNDVAASDVQMNTSLSSGVWFAVRELAIAAVVGPLALWGRVNHWLPLRFAQIVALRTSRTPDEPATNTIVAGLVFVLTFYAAQISVIAWWLGWVAAVAYAISLPLSATWDFRYADRVRRGFARVGTYLRFRRNQRLHQQLLDDLAWVRGEAIALDELLERIPTTATATL